MGPVEMRSCIPGIAALFFIFNLNCSLFSPQITLFVQCPELPGHWQRAFGTVPFLLLYPNADGKVSERIVEPWKERVTITVLKQNNLPVAAYPLVKNGKVKLRPAGGIFPLDLCEENQNVLKLSWDQGIVAEILICLFSEAVDITALNSRRLSSEIKSRGEGDPWLLNIDYITDRLASRQFRVTYIKKAPARHIQINPGGGEWFLESPFCTPHAIEAEQILVLENVPLGFHRLFDSMSSCYFDLYLDEISCHFIRKN